MDSLENFCVVGNLVLYRVIFAGLNGEVYRLFSSDLIFQDALTKSTVLLVISSRFFVFRQDALNGRAQCLVCLKVSSCKLIYEMIEKPNFNARVTLNENHSLLLVFLLSLLVNGILRFILNQSVGINDEKYLIGTFLRVLAKLLIDEF